VLEAMSGKHTSDSFSVRRFEDAQRAIRGHFKEARKDGSSLGREFHHVFPVKIGINGRVQAHRLGWDRYQGFVVKGPKPRRARVVEEKAVEPEMTDEEKRANKERGLALVQSVLAGKKIGG
jgi:hypothetical protein